jgi:transporter family-2 protein
VRRKTYGDLEVAFAGTPIVRRSPQARERGTISLHGRSGRTLILARLRCVDSVHRGTNSGPETWRPLERVGPPDLELFVLIEVEQKDFAPCVEVVARVWQKPPKGVLDLDAGHELSLALAPLAFRRTPGGTVISPAPAVGTIPESRIADRYSSHVSNTTREACLNYVVLLAVSAGMAIALQVTVNSIGLRDLGIGGLIGISGLATAAVGLLTTLMTDRPEYTSKALLCALVSGVLGAFILGSIVLAAGQGGVARTLSLVIASQLIAGLVIDRAGLLGAAPQEIGTSRILGIALILIGGVLVVRS